MNSRSALESLRGTSFARLHLRHNPFAVLDRPARARAACVETEELADFLRGPRRVLQLVADHGRGKSTLLIALHARHFPDAPFQQLHIGDPVPGAAGGAEISFVDSIENLGWFGRQRLYRRRKTLAVTTHRDLSRELRRAGLDVKPVTVGIAGCDDLHRIVEARIRGAALEGGEPPRPTRAELERLHAAYGDDVRSIEAELFQTFEDLRRARGSGAAGQHLAGFHAP